MDIRIRERLIGALVLVTLIVFVVPAVLKGPATTGKQPAAPESRRVEIDLEGAAGQTEGEGLVPEPEIAQARPEVPALAAPAPAEPTPASAPAPMPAPTPVHADNATAKPVSPDLRAAIEPVGPGISQQPAWAVQLGAFTSRSKADGLVAKLRSRGYSAFVLEYRAGGQLLHRVRVGPEQDRARAVAIAERLRKDGYQPVVAPHP